MIPRALPALLLPALTLLPGGGEPERDPFLAALAGRSGPAVVAAPSFDAEAEASSWSARPRREIVDGLAALLLRGEEGRGAAKGPAAEPRILPPPPSRIPADIDSPGVPVSDRLAAWVPADAAAVFFPSLREAEDLVGGMAGFLPRALPAFCEDSPGGRREALRRAVERLLLPTVWGANPGVRTGTRQVAVVSADPDLRWGADVAFVAEVDDASLVEFHRRSSMRWEGRGSRVLRVDGLDAVADDGSIRSFFGMRGGVAVWATTRDLRDRILAAGEGKAASLLRPDARAYALARRTFPASGGGALLVVPDGFLARANSAALLAKRAAALRCEAARLLLDARSLAGGKEPPPGFPALACPSGGTLQPVAGHAGSSCSVHGTAEDPVPLGDLPAAQAPPIPLGRSRPLQVLPVAARYPGPEGALYSGSELPVRKPARGDTADLLVPPSAAGEALLEALRLERPDGEAEAARRIARVARLADLSKAPGPLLRALTGLSDLDPEAGSGAEPGIFWNPAAAPPGRPAGGVMRLSLLKGGGGSSPKYEIWSLLLEWL